MPDPFPAKNVLSKACWVQWKVHLWLLYWDQSPYTFVNCSCRHQDTLLIEYNHQLVNRHSFAHGIHQLHLTIESKQVRQVSFRMLGWLYTFSTYAIDHPKLVQQFLVQYENIAVCKCFINSEVHFQWILQHNVLFFGKFWKCWLYVFHINWSWLDNRTATSCKNNKLNPKCQVSQKIVYLFVSVTSPKTSSQMRLLPPFLFFLVNSSMVNPIFWHRTEQVESSFKRNASTRVVHICSVESCTAVCSGVRPRVWGVNWPCIPVWTMGEGWELSSAAGGLNMTPMASGMGNRWAAVSCQW